ncbi:transketolase C-terminal domain-containing protein [Caldilinea sp.]|uniref:transketolase family protein n=1 Tax=Caldilinea sp. TaxID=2293560 RepID=UPI002B591E68|nr:transketolase C-terminal domain-containing protein [Caldilinea sp.]
MQPLQPGSPNQQVFSDTLLKLAEHDRNVLVVTSDSRGSGRLVAFGKQLPAQIVEVGIAEQNLVGVAAGLAASGKCVFAVSPACFLTARGLEQIKNDVAYSDQPVKLVGISAGVSYGALGTTHHSLHDLAVLQAFNNIDIVIPADNFETRAALEAAITHPRPLYIRLGKKAMHHLHAPETPFAIGKAIPVRRGGDVAFLATGETVEIAVQAADALAERGIRAEVLSIHSLRPFDEAAVLETARRVAAIVTVEEHSVHGGLGSRVATLLMQAGVTPALRIVGIPDEYTYTGSQQEIFAHYAITPAGLAATAESLLEGKQELVDRQVQNFE